MSFIRTGLREMGLKIRRQRTRMALRHFPLISKRQERLLVPRDAFERKASKLVEYPRPEFA